MQLTAQSEEIMKKIAAGEACPDDLKNLQAIFKSLTNAAHAVGVKHLGEYCYHIEKILEIVDLKNIGKELRMLILTCNEQLIGEIFYLRDHKNQNRSFAAQIELLERAYELEVKNS
jgi:HPt (histidine-containing phosphotransfer) domain-containing protein